MREKIIKALARVTGLKRQEVQLEVPENEDFGDYASNFALRMFSRGKGGRIKGKTSQLLINFTSPSGKQLASVQLPREFALALVEKLKKDKELEKVVDKIEIAGPGFINFYLAKTLLLENLREVLERGEDYGRSNFLKGKKYLIEHTSPNTIKTLHIGHVRNNVLGMALHNIMEFNGADVKLDAINNDRGIHVMKAVWAYMKYGKGETPHSKREKPDHFVNRFYMIGADEAEKNPKAKEEMQELLRRWEKGDEEVRAVWKKLRDLTYEGFLETYKRLGSHHDQQWFESDFYELGKEIVQEGLSKGIFRRLEDGAVLSNLGKYGLSDAIVLRGDGTSMYHTQDLYLTKLKREKFPSDLYIWIVGPEQELYLKQLFAMCEQLGIGRREDYYHLSYGFVYLKGKGKMSSRKGTVISADWLMDEVVARAKKIIEKSETSRGLSKEEIVKIAESVGLGAIKYGFLKLARETDIQFDIDESLSLEGHSAPYLQYTYARTQSVLRKAKDNFKNTKFPRLKFRAKSLLGNKSNTDLGFRLNREEELLIRGFVHFPEVVIDSAKNYSPNLLCNYLYDLAQKFNLFYNMHKILLQRKKERDQSEFRLALTTATGSILKTGLKLLGIEAPERM